MLNRLRRFLPSDRQEGVDSSMYSGVNGETNGVMMSENDAETTQVAMLGMGCFWGTEHMFLKHFPIHENKGLINTRVGFINGAEAIRITFDPSKLTYDEILVFFFRCHDPTQKDGQGNDKGKSYRSAIFPLNDSQSMIARSVLEKVQKEHFDPKGTTIVTSIEKAGKWSDASESHQRYIQKHPGGYVCRTHRLWW